ncbi:MAG: hypothetical protein RL385_5660 [Pseudomonadota bacterium]|jgi:hypothetical protein
MYRLLRIAGILACLGAVSPDLVRAEDRARASVAFDAGVSAYEAGDYPAAAEAFLGADVSAPNPVALSNALAAAEHLPPGPLRSKVSEHVLAQAGISEDLRRRAEALKSEPLPELAVSACRGENCTGVAQATSHVASAEAAPAPTEADLVPASPNPAGRESQGGHNPWVARVFFGVTGVAALTFAGVGTYAGIAALHGREERDSHPESYDPDDVRRHARRADYFLGAGLVCASAALASGLVWVDWGRGHGSVVIAVPGGGALLRHGVRF